MPFGLKIDPRAVTSFKDFGLKDVILKSLPSTFHSPLPMQKKMLALNTSGIGMFSRSTPKNGKTTAVMLGLLSTPKLPPPQITNLVLVPTPALADQYRDSMNQLGASNPHHFQVLYRTGSEELDEEQHRRLYSKSDTTKSTHVHTLIATPQRVLDYLSVNPDLLALRHIRQLVVEELDVFSNPAKITPLEILIEYLLHGRVAKGSPECEPIITLLTSAPAAFTKLPQILQKCQRPLYEVNDEPKEWIGKTIYHKCEKNSLIMPAGCYELLKKAWHGPGLVIPPSQSSPAKLQAEISSLDGAVVARPQEVAGINIDNLTNVYIFGEHPESDIHRLKWMMTGENCILHLFI